jgi:surface protein
MKLMLSGAKAFDQDISDWDVSNVANMAGLLQDAGLSTENYDALLIGWASQALQSDFYFDGGSSQYSAGAAAAARQTLIDTFGWIVTDGGLAP